MTSPHIDDSEFHALRELSATLGADPLRTQGAGCNTSIKPSMPTSPITLPHTPNNTASTRD